MNAISPPQVLPGSLSNLPEVPLNAHYQAIWEAAQKICGGPPACRHRMIAEAHDLLVLAQLSTRLLVHWLDLSSGLRAKVEMDVPTPCLPDPAGPLQVAPRALLGVMYPQEAMVMPLPGYAFVRILAPRPVWCSNVSNDPNQVLCLGPRLPAGTPLKEIILMTYGALSLQTTQINLLDPAGVLNPAAADWWQRNTSRIPLTREPFLRSEQKHDA
jgi:hypothetical protein